MEQNCITKANVLYMYSISTNRFMNKNESLIQLLLKKGSLNITLGYFF